MHVNWKILYTRNNTIYIAHLAPLFHQEYRSWYCGEVLLRENDKENIFKKWNIIFTLPVPQVYDILSSKCHYIKNLLLWKSTLENTKDPKLKPFSSTLLSNWYHMLSPELKLLIELTEMFQY
jgi:hypothetical protein